jgi:hypothetical protein
MFLDQDGDLRLMVQYILTQIDVWILICLTNSPELTLFYGDLIVKYWMVLLHTQLKYAPMGI